MTRTAIVYSTGHGHTHTVAQHLKQDADAFPGAKIDLIEITPAQLQSEQSVA